MDKTIINRPEIKLVGISVRTSYENELDKMKGKIFPCVRRYFHEKLAEGIANRINPGTTFCAYTGYDSDHTGSYTYFIGEEVDAFEQSLPEDLEKLIIPPQKYAKFTTKPAPMPDVIRDAWIAVWKMEPANLGGHRAFKTDFEIYDQRAADHQNIVLDLFVGLK